MKKKVFRERYSTFEVTNEDVEATKKLYESVKKPTKRGKKNDKSNKQYITSCMFMHTVFLLVIN